MFVGQNKFFVTNPTTKKFVDGNRLVRDKSLSSNSTKM